MATSYNGWPASRSALLIGINQRWEPIPGHRFPGGCKRGDVETVLTYVVRQLHARVERIDRDAIKDEWGWYYKPSANSPHTLSCHSSGTAFDYNATRHPNGRRGTWTRGQVAEIREILAECGGVVRWLGDASRVPDEMHFEIRGTRSQVAAVAARLRKAPPRLTAAPPSPPQPEDIEMIIVACTGKPTRLLAPPTCAVIDGATVTNLNRAGVKIVAFEPDDYDALLAHIDKALAG